MACLQLDHSWDSFRLINSCSLSYCSTITVRCIQLGEPEDVNINIACLQQINGHPLVTNGVHWFCPMAAGCAILTCQLDPQGLCTVCPDKEYLYCPAASSTTALAGQGNRLEAQLQGVSLTLFGLLSHCSQPFSQLRSCCCDLVTQLFARCLTHSQIAVPPSHNSMLIYTHVRNAWWTFRMQNSHVEGSSKNRPVLRSLIPALLSACSTCGSSQAHRHSTALSRYPAAVKEALGLPVSIVLQSSICRHAQFDSFDSLVIVFEQFEGLVCSVLQAVEQLLLLL